MFRYYLLLVFVVLASAGNLQKKGHTPPPPSPSCWSFWICRLTTIPTPTPRSSISPSPSPSPSPILSPSPSPFAAPSRPPAPSPSPFMSPSFNPFSPTMSVPETTSSEMWMSSFQEIISSFTSESFFSEILSSISSSLSSSVSSSLSSEEEETVYIVQDEIVLSGNYDGDYLFEETSETTLDLETGEPISFSGNVLVNGGTLTLDISDFDLQDGDTLTLIEYSSIEGEWSDLYLINSDECLSVEMEPTYGEKSMTGTFTVTDLCESGNSFSEISLRILLFF